jgi:hypothetical protein
MTHLQRMRREVQFANTPNQFDFREAEKSIQSVFALDLAVT